MKLYYVYQSSEDAEYMVTEIPTAASMLDIKDSLPDTDFYCTYAESPQEAILQTKEVKKDSEIK